ncbi:xanthine dehydrogenase family protein subunit M [Flavobacteriaceae bacterium TP-CH-4]|uniref:Xanthine dehydrogenase family protein subunit M n=1 Tax=Pelagihabitans pacificus TaxID=2696054 RepID=A0A967E5X2_9FLAO|nr:xanthine dehydrogenase family protein subunit M [Pelagihabitans pacificus]NHF59882.1 xanthine dehydrogenase family protein subunit M [Pelagihabitans pacificus]
MIPANFNYHKATSLKEAIALAGELGEEAKYMSGGHSLLPMMKLRFATPEHIIDISKIEGLSYIKEEGEFLKIGALTTQTEIEHSPLLKEHYPIFGDAVWLTADPSVRNCGTIGGNIAHGDAANDQPALMLAVRATIIAEGPDGTKTIPIDEFFHGFYMTALEPGDILTEIQIPKAKKNSGGAYYKMERKVGDYATAGVAVHVELDDDGVCQEIGIGLTNVSAVPMRLERGEEVLRGKKITDELIAEVGQIASEDCEPESDLRGSEAYKRSIVNTITKRMLNKALERARQ